MQLRPYQEDLMDRTRTALGSHKSVLIQAPTGAGKTALTVHMMGRAAQRGNRSFFMVHQNELLSQTSKALWKQKLEHGLIASGKRKSNLPAQVASVQTLVRRLDMYDEPQLIITDECHRSVASTYQRIFDRYPNAKLIGLTATPERTDGKGLGDVFETMVMGPSIRWLIDNDYLCDYEIFAPPSIVDVSDVKKIGGDYNKEQLEGILDKSSITGDAVSHYKTHTNGKRCVVMCVTIKHAEHVAEQYRLSGINSAVLHGGLTDNERETILSNFAKGIIKVLTNVQLMIEGVDIPAIEVIQWLRPTQSLIVWMQGNGRGFRTHEGKDNLVIFDHVGNVLRHGLPDDEREWSLEGRKARTRKKDDDEAVVKIQQCQKCYHIFRPGVHACPSCGAPIEFKPRVELQIIEADLVKVDLDAQRKQAKREQGSARTLRELIQLGLRRGLNKPAEWAVIVECTRKGTKPTKAQFAEAKRVMMEVIKG